MGKYGPDPIYVRRVDPLAVALGVVGIVCLFAAAYLVTARGLHWTLTLPSIGAIAYATSNMTKLAAYEPGSLHR